MKGIKKGVLPPTYFIILLLLSIGLHFIFPIKKIIFTPCTYLGFAFIIFGGAINIWADMLLKKNKTTVKPHENPTQLITSGPFRISRNPQYLGFTAILLGVAINHGTLITFLPPIAFFVLIESMFIPFEERNLERIFGKEYLDYKIRVRRWL
jgi:protein-S-isoprenylcysteine O-methyltransferase Ste14